VCAGAADSLPSQVGCYGYESPGGETEVVAYRVKERLLKPVARRQRAPRYSSKISPAKFKQPAAGSSRFGHIRFTGRICCGRKIQNFATLIFKLSGVATDDK
jgi:hypothetical protein